MIAIPISSYMHEAAMEVQKARQNLVDSWQIPNYTGVEAKDRWYIGAMGELAFLELIKYWNCWYEYAPQTGKSDHGDFILIDKNNERKVADIKTVGQPYPNTQLLVPQAQFDRAKYDWYIGARLNHGDVELWGYTTPDRFEPSTNPKLKGALSVPFRQLTDINDLWVQLRRPYAQKII